VTLLAAYQLCANQHHMTRGAFDYAGLTVWNSLPDELRNSDSFDSVKRFMKTILFSRYYCVQRIRGYFYNEMRCINLRFTYLLTYLLLSYMHTFTAPYEPFSPYLDKTCV